MGVYNNVYFIMLLFHIIVYFIMLLFHIILLLVF